MDSFTTWFKNEKKNIINKYSKEYSVPDSVFKSIELELQDHSWSYHLIIDGEKFYGIIQTRLSLKNKKKLLEEFIKHKFATTEIMWDVYNHIDKKY